MVKSKTGTREWAQHNKNFENGCPNDCRYCYARYDAVVRFGRKTMENWKTPEINAKKFDEKPKFLEGRIMFPTTHDIHKDNIYQCVFYLKRWLAVGNEILIVSKPDPECIKILCKELEQYKKQIVFRFTIGTLYEDVQKFWEPGAPTPKQRLEALKIAFEAGYKTSVSCEPYLDEGIIAHVEQILPYIADVVWIGKMNRIKPRVDTSKWTEADMAYLKRVRAAQTDEYVRMIYKHFKSNPKVKWKDSIKRVIGLAEEAIG